MFDKITMVKYVEIYVGGTMNKKTVTLLVMLFAFWKIYSDSIVIHLSSGDTFEIDTSEIIEITFDGEVTIQEMVNILKQVPIKLVKNYPNPFNPKTIITFELSQSGKTSVTIYNLKGQKVKTLVNEELISGNHSFTWNGTDENNYRVASGVYFYKVAVNNSEKISKMIMLK
jgi:hypothetical protein